jgi:cobalt-zinc-cadmium efflux system membrane fusion protein
MSGTLKPFVLLPLMIFAACGNEPRTGREEHHEQADAPEHAEAARAPGTVRIDPEMLRDLRITTTRAESRQAGDGVTVLGELGVNEDRYAEVGTPIEARVMRLLASAGDSIRKGQPLVELQSMELGKARAAYLSARARSELASQALERKRGLAAERIAPARELQEAEAEARTAEAEREAAEAVLAALGIAADEMASRTQDASTFTLRSPVSGTVIRREAALGQLTGHSAALFRVADLSRLWLTVHVFERDAVRVTTGAPARVTFSALPGRQFDGVVGLIGKEVDIRSRTIPVRLEIANGEDLLRPGMSASAWLPVGDAAGRIVSVPSASLQRLENGWYVFLPGEPGLFEMREVGRGRDLGGEVEVVSGLQAGETVVVEGAFLLKAEAEKSRGEGEHHDH